MPRPPSGDPSGVGLHLQRAVAPASPARAPAPRSWSGIPVGAPTPAFLPEVRMAFATRAAGVPAAGSRPTPPRTPRRQPRSRARCPAGIRARLKCSRSSLSRTPLDPPCGCRRGLPDEVPGPNSRNEQGAGGLLGARQPTLDTPNRPASAQNTGRLLRRRRANAPPASIVDADRVTGRPQAPARAAVSSTRASLLKCSSPFATSTTTLSPSWKRPSRISSASLSSSSR